MNCVNYLFSKTEEERLIFEDAEAGIQSQISDEFKLFAATRHHIDFKFEYVIKKNEVYKTVIIYRNGKKLHFKSIDSILTLLFELNRPFILNFDDNKIENNNLRVNFVYGIKQSAYFEYDSNLPKQLNG
jgi:hypothetical protein